MGRRCAVVWDGRMERSLVGWFGDVNGCPPNLLSRQNKNQAEREILENGTNPEILQIMKNKQKCTKPEISKDPAKKKKIRKTKSENKTVQAKPR